ncbi:hypothetical protein HYX00_05195, partial [Candidatus Woesearchaeota archaeon]|nr:hypothetical protein [Candidatus Woesearchaeota archaeon]
REIAWKRAYKSDLNDYKLTVNEINMLDRIGINYDVYNVGNYKTIRGVNKSTILIRIAGRENLLKLRKLITIPHSKKDKTFTDITNGFVRYKEPLRIKDAIIKISKEKGFVTSSELKKEMNYKSNTANKWIKFYASNGLIKCVEKNVNRKIPAKYVLSEA